jgi:hypothetical protein
MSWGGKTTWGSWHTSVIVPGPCPQDGRFHSVEEAADLNEKNREYNRGVLYDSMRRWREAK